MFTLSCCTLCSSEAKASLISAPSDRYAPSSSSPIDPTAQKILAPVVLGNSSSSKKNDNSTTSSISSRHNDSVTACGAADLPLTFHAAKPAIKILTVTVNPAASKVHKLPPQSNEMQYVVVAVWSLTGQMVAEIDLDLDNDTLASLRAAVEAKTGVSSEHLRFSFGNAICCQDFADTTKLRVCLGKGMKGTQTSVSFEDCVGEGITASPDTTTVDTPETFSTTQRQRLLRARSAPLDGIESEADVTDTNIAKEKSQEDGVVSSCDPVQEKPKSPVCQVFACRKKKPLLRARSAPLSLDTVETTSPGTKIWSESAFGTILHEPTGTWVSPARGIQVDGTAYRLAPEDIDLPQDQILGSGSGGVVQVGWHKPSCSRVAVKTIKVGSDDRQREQMLKEITGLVHAAGCPYLVQWFAGFVDPSSYAVKVVIEFMDRGSFADLRQRLCGRGLPPDHSACAASQITKGLHHLQMRTLLHRDVKPENILHNKSGQVKLTDFGISKHLGNMPCVGTTFVGTATYMAPERASGGDYSYESDVWSAGLVIYELATGRYPFGSASFAELFECLCDKPEPRLDKGTFPELLCDFVACCLTRDQAARPDAATLSRHEIVSRLHGRHISAFALWLTTLRV